jgi:uncharacterized repeat protein (TIGR01451 family)
MLHVVIFLTKDRAIIVDTAMFSLVLKNNILLLRIRTVAHIKLLKNFTFLVCSCLLVAQANAAPTVVAAPTAVAGKKEAVQINLELFKIVAKDGKETLVSAKETKPGEILEYRATYKNVSKSAVRNLIATLPVPKGMEYQVKTASPAGAEATIDNVTFSAIPLIDTTKKEAIPTSQYRALRWKVSELGADKSIVVSARMKISQQ